MTGETLASVRFVVRSSLAKCLFLLISFVLWHGAAYAQNVGESVDEISSTAVENEKPSADADGVSEAKPSTPLGNAITIPGSSDEQEYGAIKPSAPDIYLLPDRYGKLRKVLGFRYEDFFRAWEQSKGADAPSPPPYVLKRWEVTGNADEKLSELEIRFLITVQSKGWIDIPVQLSEFIVQEIDIKDKAVGECVIFDRQHGGYLIWLSDKSKTQREIVLRGIAQVKSASGNSFMELRLPRASTSRFSVQFPKNASKFEAPDGLGIATRVRAQDKPEVRVTGQANPFRLSWTNLEQPEAKEAALVEVEENTTIRVQRRRATYDAALKINSFGDELQQFRVRLPRRAKLITGDRQSEFEISPVASPRSEDQQQEVDVRILNTESGPWSVKLKAERSIDAFGELAECRLQGFEVLNAFQQSGTVTLEVDDQLDAYFDKQNGIEQIAIEDSLTPSSGMSILGNFRYARFPWQLVLFTSPRQRRITVEPTYQLSVNSDEARLNVEYDYELTGAQVFSLRVNLRGWDRTEAPVESGGAIDPNSVIETHDDRLVLRLVDPSTTSFKVKLSLRKDIEVGENIFQLPEPTEATVQDGNLRVQAAEALKLTALPEQFVGLASVSTGFTDDVSADGSSEQDSDLIRLRTFLPAADFVASVSQRSRELSATQSTTVEFDSQDIRVRQEIDYQSKYKPVSRLSFAVPEAILSNDSFAVSMGNEALPFTVSDLGDTDESESMEVDTRLDATFLRNVDVALPRPMQNSISIVLTHEAPAPELSEGNRTSLSIPLAMPEVRVDGHSVEIHSPPQVTIGMSQSVGEELQVSIDSDQSVGKKQTLTFEFDDPVYELPLTAQSSLSDHEQLATLERAWIQTWFAVGKRQERAVFRFRTPHEKVIVELPSESLVGAIEVLLDGLPAEHQLIDGNRLSIAVGAASTLTDDHTLELRYQSKVSLPSWGNVKSVIPRLVCRAVSAPIYWHLILPRDWQVVGAPNELIPDYWLGWRHYRWGRQPRLTQADFEQYTNSVSMSQPPPLSNQYTYRALEIPAEVKVTVVRQVWVYSLGALCVFGIGLLYLYTPLLQYGVVWLAIALLSFVGVFHFPEITLVAIELVLVGGAMTLAASVLKHIFRAGAVNQLSVPKDADHEAEETEPWQQQVALGKLTSESTATLKTGGSAS